jgi:hypothetical protein
MLLVPILALDRMIIKLSIKCQKMTKINNTFDLVPKNEFDLLPNLRETFNLVFRSSEIRSSDQLPFYLLSQLLTHIGSNPCNWNYVNPQKLQI